MARAVARRRTPRARTAKPVAVPKIYPVAERVVRVDLLEEPHAHVVCRSCGRIQRIELNELDRHLLTQLAEQHPEGWSVDGIAFSLTGACQRCREGPTLRR
jgi:Fe2+ or Zn2+ uptake regulation protein